MIYPKRPTLTREKKRQRKKGTAALDGCNRGYIPMKPIHRIVVKHLRDAPPTQDGQLTSFQRLCIDAKVNPKRMKEIVAGENHCLDFDIADRILASLGMTHLWWAQRTELGRIYRQVDLTGKSLSKPWIPEQSFATCEVCGEGFSYYVDPHQKRKSPRRFCSQRCGVVTTNTEQSRERKSAAMAGQGYTRGIRRQKRAA